MLRAWRAEHGDWCPGYVVAPHYSDDLTLDHPEALARGGPILPVNPGVLCRGCNSRKRAKAA